MPSYGWTQSAYALVGYGETQYNKKMFGRLKDFTKNHQQDIVLVLGVTLISLLSFAMGYIVAKQQEKEPIKIEYNPNLQIKSESTNNLFGSFGCYSDNIRIIIL